MIILPGIMNLELPLAWLRRMLVRAYPHCLVTIRPWGRPFGWIFNLQAHERNRVTAAAFGQELAAYRGLHPDARITLVGYSGGGGLAAMIVGSLPEGVTINRLILVAPAISPFHPITDKVLPRVSEFVVAYASRFDLQVGQGTKLFGNMDGIKGKGAGAVGFATEDYKLVQVHWDRGMMRTLHFGDHFSYLSPLWQRHYLVPALDPAMTVRRLREHVAGRRFENRK